MNITEIGNGLAALEAKLVDETGLSVARKTALLQNVVGCREAVKQAAKEIDDALISLGNQIVGHFDEHVGALNDFIGEKPAEEQPQIDKAA